MKWIWYVLDLKADLSQHKVSHWWSREAAKQQPKDFPSPRCGAGLLARLSSGQVSQEYWLASLKWKVHIHCGPLSATSLGTSRTSSFVAGISYFLFKTENGNKEIFDIVKGIEYISLFLPRNYWKLILLTAQLWWIRTWTNGYVSPCYKKLENISQNMIPDIKFSFIYC